MTNSELASLLDVPFTFSANCVSGIAKRCECWRCRKARNEEPDDVLAESVANDARERFGEKTRALLDWMAKLKKEAERGS